TSRAAAAIAGRSFPKSVLLLLLHPRRLAPRMKPDAVRSVMEGVGRGHLCPSSTSTALLPDTRAGIRHVSSCRSDGWLANSRAARGQPPCRDAHSGRREGRFG